MFVKGPNWSAGHDTGTKVRENRRESFIFFFFFGFLPALNFLLSLVSLSLSLFLSSNNPLLSQDSLFTLSKPVAGGELDVVQAVPGGRWFLVPSPLLRYTRRFSGGGDGDGGDGGGGGG